MYSKNIDKKMSVAFVYSQPLFGLKGGTEKVFCDMANALVDRNYVVTGFIYDQKSGRPSFNLKKSVNITNLYSKIGIFRKGFFRTLRCWNFDKTDVVAQTRLTPSSQTNLTHSKSF